MCAGQTGMVFWMKVPIGEELATRTNPESCAAVRKGRGEALTGGRAGWVLSREIHEPTGNRRSLRGADVLKDGGRRNPTRRYREMRRDPARSKTPRMHGCTMHGNREIPRPPAGNTAADRTGKSKDVRR